VILKVLSGGRVIARARADVAIAPGDSITVRAVNNGSRLSVFLNGSDTPIVDVKAPRSLQGIAGLEVRGTHRTPASASMEAINVR
jgi:hypothetical protein